MDKNFNTIRRTISNLVILSESSNNDELYKVWNKAVNDIKSSDILKQMYFVYEGVDNAKFQNQSEAELYLNECLMIFNAFDKKQILNEMTTVYNTLGNYIIESDGKDQIYGVIMESTKDRKITKLIERMDSIKEIAKNMVSETVDEECDVEEDKIINVEDILNEFEALNEKYSFLSDQDKSIVQAFVTKDEALKEELFYDLINEGIKYVKREIFRADEDNHELINMLSETEHKLKAMEFNESVDIDTFVRLSDLKN